MTVTVTAPPPGLVVVPGVVVVAGGWLDVVRRAAQAAQERRTQNGLPPGRAYGELAQAVATALAAAGQTDPAQPGGAHHGGEPTVTVLQAARQLGVSERHVRRLAPRLGGKRIGGRWLLDPEAVQQHLEGKSLQ